ncbi:MAG: sulfite exporter TauE/SafE family protein [Rhodospirillales bacterium]|nr:sulfite exporter TauE/SafE family protein [Alphaproteobacteria bacterium]MCB9981262.1 sulfite exporter TauE/SafE family protein [Rhodospirillales bacterium]
MIIAQCVQNFNTAYGLPVSLFLAGLFGGFTHCAGMCAPFVLAQTTQDTRLQKLSSKLLLPYHLGRMTTYVILAVIVNALINMAFLFSDLKILVTAPLLMLAGTIFIITAFPNVSALFPWAARLQVVPTFKIISRLSKNFMTDPNIMKRYGLGILLGFMPCGLVLSALLAAATADTALYAAFAMSAFTLGTIPALLMVTLGGQALKKAYPKATQRFSRGAMIISGLWLFTLASIMLTGN